MIQSADASQRRLYERTLATYTKALRAFEAGVRYDYGGLNPLPGCPQFTSVATLPKPSGSSLTNSTTQGSTSPSSAHSRTLELLQKRQEELRMAAAQAKSRGDMNAARDYLRSSLSMNNMIRAVNAGLPIDLKQLPPAPRAARTGASTTGVVNLHTQPILSGIACDPPVDFQTALVTAGNGLYSCLPFHIKAIACIISGCFSIYN